MAGRIPQIFIDQLVDRIDIVDLIGSYVSLRKSGREHQARCPFHDEKTPSFTVSASKQFYHCFGCGAHGTALSFLMEYCHLDFVEAVEDLAARLGLDVPREGGHATPNQQDFAPLYKALTDANQIYRQQLAVGDADKARNYLQQRQLSAATIDHFSVGYAPAAWDTLCRHLLKSAQDQQALLDSGLISSRQDGQFYDRFRDRIIFPIRDTKGRVIAFGGRIIHDGTPKYLNSPETPTFHKSNELYGLYELRQAQRKIDRIVIVEGYMDVLMLAQHGINYAVATLGTATTEQHLGRLFRLCSSLVFCFDGDKAGRKAAWKALAITLPLMREGLNVRFLFLPDGDDPDTFVQRQGQQAFEQQLDQAQSLSDYFFSHLLATTPDQDSIEGRARLASRANEHLARLPTGIYREMMTQRLAELAQLDAQTLASHLKKRSQRASTDSPTQRFALPQEDNRPSLIRRAITLLLHAPTLATDCPEPAVLKGLLLPGAELLIELLQLLQQQPDISSAALIERWRETPFAAPLSALLAKPMLISEEEMRIEFQDAMQGLQRRHIDQQIQQLSEKPANQWSAEDRSRWQALLTSKRSDRQPV